MRNDAASALLDASRRALHDPDDVKHRAFRCFNDRIITNATCVREALIEVDLISASFNRTMPIVSGNPPNPCDTLFQP